jgi:4-hydroxybutyrate CoA-transferase
MDVNKLDGQDWKTVYNKRQSSAERAIATIESKNKVFLAPFCNEPQTLIKELVKQKGRFHNLILYNAVIGSPCLYADPLCHPHFEIRTFLGSPLLKNAFVHKVCDYLPVNLSEIPRWLEEESIDAALIQVTPPDNDGFCNLGISVDVVPILIKNAKKIIAQVNKELPITYGQSQVHVTEISHFVISDGPLLSIPTGKPTELELMIGKYVAELVPDFATIQVGIGKIADSVLLSLKTKKGMGIHSGSITDPVKGLMELGVVTNEHKEINRNKTVCTTVTGSKDLYKYIHHNKQIELYPTNYTHSAAIISQLSNFHSVNSALEIDLYGQVNAEQVSTYPVAGVGGQMDFIRGARLSRGGKAIIALPSTAKKGTVSRIKTKIPFVTSIKSEIDYVVTEYGIAKLFGKTLLERAKALVAIAHPRFREDLLFELEKN